MNWLKNIFSFIKKLFVREGLQEFLQEKLEVARSIVVDLAKVYSGEDFHKWRDEAWQRLRSTVGDKPGTWITILIHLAYEEWKARKKS